MHHLYRYIYIYIHAWCNVNTRMEFIRSERSSIILYLDSSCDRSASERDKNGEKLRDCVTVLTRAYATLYSAYLWVYRRGIQFRGRWSLSQSHWEFENRERQRGGKVCQPYTLNVDPLSRFVLAHSMRINVEYSYTYKTPCGTLKTMPG